MKTFILGQGQTPFTAANDLDLSQLASIAARAALDDAKIDVAEIELCVGGSAFEHPGVAQRVLLGLGLNGISAVSLEGACASGGAGVIEAMRWIESGKVNVAIVVGVDKMASRFRTGPLRLVGNEDPFGAQGITVPAIFGMLANHHMHTYGSTAEDFAAITFKNRSLARHNPFARFQKPPSMEEILNDLPIATPLRRLDCCANGDGAAALVIVSESFNRARGGDRGVEILAAELGGGVLGDRLDTDPMSPLAAKAYSASGIAPDDVDVVECHDNFSVGEFECYERLFFCSEGLGHRYLRDGKPWGEAGGALFNSSGGLLGRSHPAGATGCVQIGAVVQQLRGEAGPIQRKDASIGLVQTSGGGVMELQSNVSTVIILGR